MTNYKKALLFSLPALLFWILTIFNILYLIFSFSVNTETDPMGIIVVNALLSSVITSGVFLILNLVFSYKVKKLTSSEIAPSTLFLRYLVIATNWLFLLISAGVILIFWALGGLNFWEW